jgi:putative transposase
MADKILKIFRDKSSLLCHQSTRAFSVAARALWQADVQELRRDLAAWLVKWGTIYRRLCDWVETNIEETFLFYRLPREHYKHMKSTSMLERLNEEIKQLTHVVRIFPNEASCLRLIRPLAVEIHENWISATRYLNMDLFEEHKRELLQVSAA